MIHASASARGALLPANSTISLGTYPTPVERLDALSRGACALWVKRDDRSGALYGGNKVRKLEHVLFDARARGATRLVTIGAAGSHHVLATTLYGRREGFEVDAVLVPQPRTAHALTNLRVGLAHGLHPHPARAYATVPFALVPPLLAKGAYFVALGGSSVLGSMGYVDAAFELEAQVRAGAMPEPEWIVVALGSGGTAAGLAAGLELTSLRTRVLGVCISDPAWFLAFSARRLACRCARVWLGRRGQRATSGAIASRLVVDGRYIGRGYGYATAEGERAMEQASGVGLTLDPTYTAKAFAAALDRVEAGGAKNVLYWHTLSSAPLAPLLVGAPGEEALGPRVRRLLA